MKLFNPGYSKDSTSYPPKNEKKPRFLGSSSTMTACILSCSTSLHAACSKASPANVGGLFKTRGYPLLVLLMTSVSSGIIPNNANPNISCTSSTDIMSSPLIISVRTRFTIIFISLIPSHSSSPMTLSASLKLVMSGVVTSTASLAGVMAVMKPASIPAGQSMRMKSGQPSCLAFKASTTQTRALPPNPIGNLDRGFEMQSNSKLDQRLSLTSAWSRRQSPLRTSTTV